MIIEFIPVDYFETQNRETVINRTKVLKPYRVVTVLTGTITQHCINYIRRRCDINVQDEVKIVLLYSSLHVPIRSISIESVISPSYRKV